MLEELPHNRVAVLACHLCRLSRSAIETLSVMQTLCGIPILFVPENHEVYGGLPMPDNLADRRKAARNTNGIQLQRNGQPELRAGKCFGNRLKANDKMALGA